MKTFIKNITISVTVISFFLIALMSSAVTKPPADAELSSYSYVFYLYYDSGQLLGDRDYDVKFDVINEPFVQPSAISGAYRVQIFDAKSEVVGSVDFDIRNGNPNMTRGKVQVKAPYVASGVKANFYDSEGRQLMTIFVSTVSLCNDDGFCSSTTGETEKTCPSDCKKASTTPVVSALPPPVSGELDYIMLSIYGIAGIAVVVGAWFGWRWWKKRKEENFTPPPSNPAPPLNPPSSPLNTGL
jgi:hypothetical protein